MFAPGPSGCGKDEKENGHYEFCFEDFMSNKSMNNIIDNMKHNYAVVGVLEKSPKFMEVLRCRVPWVEAHQLPHEDTNSQNWEYPIKLKHNKTSMAHTTRYEQILYNLANELLEADLACCRA